MSWEPPPWWSPETVEYWKNLDHTMCTLYPGIDPDTPAYQRCHSMHCPDCGRSTSSQGHMKLVGDIKGEHEWVCPTPEEKRNPFP